MLQDAHIHLQDAGTEGRQILEAASGNGVGRFFCNGAAPSDWEELNGLARSHESVVPFFGVHPWFIGKAGNGWDARLKEYLRDGASRVGEIGLDKARRAVPFAEQTVFFARQLELAAEMKKPFAVHCVQAWDALLEELTRHIAGSVPFIVHWFSGSPETALELVKAGAYISFSPRLLEESAERHRASFGRVPVGRILLETDYPYMPGVEKGRIPSPGRYFTVLRSLYECAARLKGMDGDEFSRKVWDNGTVFVH
jgi:TatD DNase family protein